ncbi:hypothetical protein [Pantoea ananatis]|uniref:hypothetical protein n=1 Tax=Pantoea ananas TaxID=553 RepID=UPI001B310569|nr:hypothetical protein [Pantoea ananatis]
MKIIPLVVLTVLLTGCQTQANFKRNMDTWVGKDAQGLVDQWGYPAGTMKAPNGNDVYVYQNSGNYYVPPTTTYNTTANIYGNSLYSTTTANTSGGYNISFTCTVYFEVNSLKKIERVSWQGNNCVA